VVFQADIFAVAAFPADLFDHAVAGGENRRAVGGRPVHAGVHLGIAEDRMAATAEAGTHDGAVDRLADQELLRAFAGLVIKVDDGIVRGLKAVVFFGLAADGQSGIQHFGFFVVGGAFVLAGEVNVEGIARLHLALEVDVIGIDADHVLDDGGRHLVAHRSLVDALVEADAAAVIIIVIVVVLAGGGIGDGIHALDVDGDVFADVRQGRHGLDDGFVGDDHAIGLRVGGGAGPRDHHQDADLLAFLQAAVAAAGAKRQCNRPGLIGRRAEVAQNGRNRVALFHDVNAFAGGIAAGDLLLGLRQQGDV